jgi:16S rRNA (guanine(1405)-N(7))-methyltransferase
MSSKREPAKMSHAEPRSEVEQIVANVLGSQKYRSLCASTVRRVAAEEWAKRAALKLPSRRALKMAIKATRSRLHQAYSAYESSVDYERAYSALESAYAGGAPETIRSACRDVLALHASTRERLPILDSFYERVLALTGRPRILLDLACGLNPLSLPWMGLGSEAVYHAYDIDGDRVAFLNRYLALAGVQGGAYLQDVLCEPPVQAGDVALLMKSSTCLERQRKGSTLALLDALLVSHVVVTFPVQSLGRHEKGMVEHYGTVFDEMVAGRRWAVARLDFATELVFVVTKIAGSV